MTDVPRVDPEKPYTWGDCSCGALGTSLVKVDKPGWQNVNGEARLGDYSGQGRTKFERYFVVCDGCREVGEDIDRITRFWRSTQEQKEKSDG